MKIVEELINQETIDNYKDELFLFAEKVEDLKGKRIIKVLNESDEIISIAMYSRLNNEDIELYIDKTQENIKPILQQGIYLDAITSLKHGYNACKDVIGYLMNENKTIWCYSYYKAIEFWKNKMNWIDVGNDIFINKIA